MDELARHVSFLAGKLHIPVEVIRHADEVGSPDIRGLLSCGKDIRGWYDIPSQRICPVSYTHLAQHPFHHFAK